MRNRVMGLMGMIVAAAALALSPAMLAQTGATPNLSGVWMARENIRTFNTQEPPPLAPSVVGQYRANRSGIEDPLASGVDEQDPTIYCLTDGFPRIYLSNYPVEIVQAPGKIYMLFESGHLVRRIHLDGQRMPDAYPPSFMGYSTGRWDGNTLVVETAGLNDLSWMDRTGTPHSDALQVTERIRRVAQDAMEIDFVFNDSKAFTKPWTGKKAFQLQPDWEIMEQNGVCEDRHRENYSRRSLVGTSEWTNPEGY